MLRRSPAQKLSNATDGLQYWRHLSLLTARTHTRHLHRSRSRPAGSLGSQPHCSSRGRLARMGVPRNKCQLSGSLLNEYLARSLVSADGPDQSSLLLRCCIRLASNLRKWASDATACASSCFSRFQGDATYTHVHTYAPTYMLAFMLMNACMHVRMYQCTMSCIHTPST